MASVTISTLGLGGNAVSAVYAGNGELAGTRPGDASAVEIHAVR